MTFFHKIVSFPTDLRISFAEIRIVFYLEKLSKFAEDSIFSKKSAVILLKGVVCKTERGNNAGGRQTFLYNSVHFPTLGSSKSIQRTFGDHTSIVILSRRPSVPLYHKSLLAELHVAIALAPIISWVSISKFVIFVYWNVRCVSSPFCRRVDNLQGDRLRQPQLTGSNFFGKTPLFLRYSGVNAANAVNLQAKRR